MSKSVLISIRPEWCEKIALYQKTIEVRKTRPKIDTPFKCYIYETQGKCSIPRFVDEEGHMDFRGRGQVIGEFICDRIIKALPGDYYVFLPKRLTALYPHELSDYADGKALYGWHISDLVIYDKPCELREFYKPGFSSIEDLDEDLCKYCYETDYGEKKCYGSPDGPVMCEGAFCESAYEAYLDEEGFTITRPPQSWCYAEELK